MISNIQKRPREAARPLAPMSGSCPITRDTLDDALIENIAAGDRSSMKVLFMRHNVRIYRFILRLINNEAIAEELVNDVFLDVWRCAGKFEGRSQVSTWLLAVARHKAAEMLRRRSTEPRCVRVDRRHVG